jgi:putative transposase
MVRNRHLAKSINDAAWSLFRRWLEYFGRKYGKVTIAVSPHNTSQNCSNCGKKVQKSLSTRTHICSCGYVDCRDRNAAINILKLGLRRSGGGSISALQTSVTAGHVGTWEQSLNAWGESTSTLVEAILPGQVGSVNQESHDLA